MEDKGCWQEEEEEEEEDAQQPVVQMRRLCPLSGSLKKKKKELNGAHLSQPRFVLISCARSEPTSVGVDQQQRCCFSLIVLITDPLVAASLHIIHLLAWFDN